MNERKKTKRTERQKDKKRERRKKKKDIKTKKKKKTHKILVNEFSMNRPGNKPIFFF